MSDELDIRHGGVIAVDTDLLRDLAGRLTAIAVLFGEAAAAIRAAHRCIAGVLSLTAHVETPELAATADEVDAVQAECEDAVVGVSLMADAYELVELRAELAALDASDAAAADALRMRIERLEASDERLADMAVMLEAQWQDTRTDGLHSQFAGPPLPWLGVGSGMLAFGTGVLALTAAATAATAAAVGASGAGRLRPGSRLVGAADPVRVEAVRTTSPAAPPATVAEALRRFPTAPGAQVKVERYRMPDGSSRFVLYANGTQSGGYGRSNPWDMKSNHELYSGHRSASYQATVDALKAAGAKPGDRVIAFAHSQGGMITARLAMESEFDVRLQVTAGSPVEPALDDDQTLVQLRHTDDLVSALAGGGSPGGTGAPDSIVVQRVGDPEVGLQDYTLEPHMLESYIETAEQLDASGDPRVGSIREQLAELAEATGIDATEYVATRVGDDAG